MLLLLSSNRMQIWLFQFPLQVVTSARTSAIECMWWWWAKLQYYGGTVSDKARPDTTISVCRWRGVWTPGSNFDQQCTVCASGFDVAADIHIVKSSLRKLKLNALNCLNLISEIKGYCACRATTILFDLILKKWWTMINLDKSVWTNCSFLFGSQQIIESQSQHLEVCYKDVRELLAFVCKAGRWFTFMERNERVQRTEDLSKFTLCQNVQLQHGLIIHLDLFFFFFKGGGGYATQERVSTADKLASPRFILIQ